MISQLKYRRLLIVLLVIANGFLIGYVTFFYIKTSSEKNVDIESKKNPKGKTSEEKSAIDTSTAAEPLFVIILYLLLDTVLCIVWLLELFGIYL